MCPKSKSVVMSIAAATALLQGASLPAGPPVTEGRINVLADQPLWYSASGFLSIAGQPPSPDPLDEVTTTASPSRAELPPGAATHWEFQNVTLEATGGLAAGMAAGVSLKLHRDATFGNDNQHVTAPHPASEWPNNVLPDIQTPAAIVLAGQSVRFWAWAADKHRASRTDFDYYMVKGDVNYGSVQGGATFELDTENVAVVANHTGKGRPDSFMPPPEGAVETSFGSALQYDAELGILSVLSGPVTGAIDPHDPMSNAWLNNMNLHLDGQDEDGSMIFHGGEFAVQTPAGEIGIAGYLDELKLYPDGGWGVFNQGGAVDETMGQSQQMTALLGGDPRNTNGESSPGAPELWIRSDVNLFDWTNGFTTSTPFEPAVVSFVVPQNPFEDSPIPGDYNGDHAVDEADLALFAADFGSTTDLMADGNGDGIVGAADFVVWRDHLSSQFSGQVASLSSVPEPTGATLGLCGFIALLGAFRQHHD